jgi:hypothetical protein
VTGTNVERQEQVDDETRKESVMDSSSGRFEHVWGAGRRHFVALTCLVVAAAAAGACASGGGRPAAAPIDTVGAIAGTWTGTLNFGAGEQPCTLIIQPNGQATIQGRTITQTGQVSVQGGRATYSFPGRSDGTVALYQGDGKRQLQLKGNSGVFDALVTAK